MRKMMKMVATGGASKMMNMMRGQAGMRK